MSYKSEDFLDLINAQSDAIIEANKKAIEAGLEYYRTICECGKESCESKFMMTYIKLLSKLMDDKMIEMGLQYVLEQRLN
jgi:hypothetical protein